jgi:hypothetical protein
MTGISNSEATSGGTQTSSGKPQKQEAPKGTPEAPKPKEAPREAIKNTFFEELDRLREKYPWPKEAPDVPTNWGGFCSRSQKRIFSDIISDSVHVILELGSWMGKSARHMAQEMGSHGTIICVDHWKGSPEHVKSDEFTDVLPTLYETFIKNQWELRDKIIMVREDTLTGMKMVHSCGIRPCIVYIDAGHEYDNVSKDISDAIALFPDALLIGDDYQKKWADVMRAWDEAAEAHSEYNKKIVKRMCFMSRGELPL